MSRHRRHRRGAIQIWIALLLTLFISLIGLATDTAYVVLTRQQLDAAADAAALAGARLVRTNQDDARQNAYDVALANSAAKENVTLDLNEDNHADGDIVIGRFDGNTQVFTPGLSGPNAVKVVARRTDSGSGSVPLLFGPIFGADTANVVSTAIAVIGGDTGAGIIVLNETDRRSFYIHGNPTLNVSGGAVQINSSHPSGGQIQGSVTVNAPEINVVGDMSFVGNSYHFNGTLDNNASVIEDPLQDLAAPTIGSPMSPPGITSNGTFSPGYYPNGLNINSSTHVTLEPGIYILGGAGFQVNGGASVTGLETTFYITQPGRLTINGTGDVILTPPESGLYEGLSFFQARNNTNTAVINGTGFTDSDDGDGVGALYFPKATIHVGGTGDMVLSQLIADKVEISGSGTKTINYTGDIPAAGFSVYLVK